MPPTVERGQPGTDFPGAAPIATGGPQDPHLLEGWVAQPPEGSCARPKGSPPSVGMVAMRIINILFLCSLQSQGTN